MGGQEAVRGGGEAPPPGKPKISQFLPSPLEKMARTHTSFGGLVLNERGGGRVWTPAGGWVRLSLPLRKFGRGERRLE